MRCEQILKIIFETQIFYDYRKICTYTYTYNEQRSLVANDDEKCKNKTNHKEEKRTKILVTCATNKYL